MSHHPGALTPLIATRGPAAVVLIRLYVGLVFACERVLKFLRPDSLGTGRFDKAGIPAPAFLAPWMGSWKSAAECSFSIGLLTRLAAMPMIIDMLGAVLITKLPIFWGHAPLFRTEHGWWDFMHESRVDLAQLCGSLFLLLVGAGAYSLDGVLTQKAALAAAAVARFRWLVSDVQSRCPTPTGHRHHRCDKPESSTKPRRPEPQPRQ
jgi:putative oxidoreductase